MKNESLKPICAQLEKIEIGAGYADKIESARKDAVKSLSNAASLKNVSKSLGSGAADFVADCLVLIRTINGMQRLIEQKSAAEWQEPQLGQARAHAYVDLWGRAASLTALLDAVMDEGGDNKASQVAARLESLCEGIKQSFTETSQILLMKGEAEKLVPVVNWAIAKFESPAYRQLSGSILKELHSL